MKLPLATMDFETRSFAKLDLVGAYKYAEHYSTEIICFAYNLTHTAEKESFSEFLENSFKTISNKSELQFAIEEYNAFHKTQLWIPSMPPPYDLFEHIEKGGLVEAHNSFFEWCIWNIVCVPVFGWPELKLESLRCSLAKAQAAGMPPSLDALGKALKLDIIKDKRGKDLINYLSKPMRISKKNPLPAFREDIGMLTEMVSYNGTDVDTEIRASKKLPDMPEFEVEVWLLDQKVNARGTYVDMDMIDSTISILDQATEKYNAILKDLSCGEFTTSGQRDKILAWCKAQGFPLAGYTKEDVARALKKKNIPAKVKKVLRIRQILGRTSTAKYKTMLSKVASDGRIHEVLNYHKAHTGRWGGRGVQVQNLPRPTLKDDPVFITSLLKTGDLKEVETFYSDPFEVASNAIRPTICAPKGKKFISADYSAIEARVLFWIAGAEKGLELFRKGFCVYTDMAADIYNKPYNEIFSAYKRGVFSAGLMRHLGKQTILGLGYQMGAPKFMITCDVPGMTEDFAKRVVKTYRGKYEEVVQLWYGLEKAAISAVKNPGIRFRYNKISYKVEGSFLKCRLPSGRHIHYAYPRLKPSMTSWGEESLSLRYMKMSKGKWVEETTYGGMLTENASQGIARDIMARGLLKAESAGYHTLMTVHDEGVSEVEENFGTLEEYIELLCDLEPWAEGLPLKAEGWIDNYYHK